MTDLDKAIAAAHKWRTATANYTMDSMTDGEIALVSLLAALDQAPQPAAAPRVERYGDGVLVHWPEGVEQYVQVGDCVTGNLAKPAAAVLDDQDPRGNGEYGEVFGKPAVPEGWSGWAIQYPGKLPKLYGAEEIARMNWSPEAGADLVRVVEVDRVKASDWAAMLAAERKGVGK